MKIVVCFSIGLLFTATTPGWADPLVDQAQACLDAARSGDQAAFEEAAAELLTWRSVFNMPVRQIGVECLTIGYGEPWAYADELGRFASVVEREQQRVEREKRQAEREAENREAAAAVARQRAAEDAARAERNQAREDVAGAVYIACAKLFARDEISALTNQVCVDSFFANGLPQP